MTIQPLPYRSEDAIGKRFFNLAAIAACKENGYNYKKNQGEEFAEAMLYPREVLPYKITKFLKDPRVVTLQVASLAMLAVSWVYYPTKTPEILREAWNLVPKPPMWAVKFSSYLLSVETILGYTVRAESRFCNTDLTDQLDGYNQAN